MRARQFTEDQIVAILQEAQKGERTIIAICHEKGIADTTFYSWRKKFGGMQIKEAQRLTDLENENARLKWLLADRNREIACLKAIIVQTTNHSPEEVTKTSSLERGAFAPLSCRIAQGQQT